MKGHAFSMVAHLPRSTADRVRCLVPVALIAVAVSSLDAGPAWAGPVKGPAVLFDLLFSIFTPAPANARSAPQAAQSVARPNADPLYPYSEGPAPAPNDGDGTYRTVCVRLCDGFYWPVSEAASMSRFQRDSTTCESSCEQPAKLFYAPSSDKDADKLVSLDGKPYTALPQAFLYRKSMTAACRCKPDPWSESEVERHRTYAPTPAPPDPLMAEGTPAAVTDAPAVEDTDVQAGNPAAAALAADPATVVKSADEPVNKSTPQTRQGTSAGDSVQLARDALKSALSD